MESAINEFAGTAYEAASISKIVENAGIAKGSYYQYFESKEDLYGFVIQEAGRIKKGYLSLEPGKMESMRTMDIIREFYRGAVAFAGDNPKIAAIGNGIFRERKTLFESSGLKDSYRNSVAFFADLIRKGISKGDVDTKVDPEVAAVLFIELNFAIVEMFLQKNAEGFRTDDFSGFEALVDKMLYIIQKGIDKS